MTKRKKMGRPRVPESERRNKRIDVNLTESERTQIEREADEANESVSEYARKRITAPTQNQSPKEPSK
jgi:hypothetical protein